MPSVILSAPWGEKCLRRDSVSSDPGKFGFGYNDLGIEVGPTAFTVAPNEDIYIADLMNHRIQRFDSTGSLIAVIPNVSAGAEIGMCVDKAGNIYNGHLYTSNPYIKKYDQNGNLIRTYWIVKDSVLETGISYKSRGSGTIYCDDSNRVFLVYKKGVIQVGTTDSVFTPSQQKASLRRGIYGFTANAPDMNRGSEMYSLLGEYVAPHYLLGMDQTSVYSWIPDEKNPELKIVDKTDYEGNWISSYQLNPKQLECELLTVFNMGRTMLFDKGNIYVFCSDRYGIKIIKLSPVDRGK
ncbi:MAG: hypothetical protein MUO85_05345 [candidate division Zixibacteria bacterium]|nr:hypothetical protein [candidate division Zixibacteria bacterium]